MKLLLGVGTALFSKILPVHQRNGQDRSLQVRNVSEEYQEAGTEDII